jgi:predicted nucleic acid-binding protein
VILVDTGPLVALFDPADGDHQRCLGLLKGVDEALVTTLPVLTEAFHLLGPESPGSKRLMDFVGEGGLTIWFLDDPGLVRAFELMRRYENVPMDFADATLVSAAEALTAARVLTLDRKDFDVYRVRRGHRHVPFQVLA